MGPPCGVSYLSAMVMASVHCKFLAVFCLQGQGHFVPQGLSVLLACTVERGRRWSCALFGDFILFILVWFVSFNLKIGHSDAKYTVVHYPWGKT